jgi:hypothetical protein
MRHLPIPILIAILMVSRAWAGASVSVRYLAAAMCDGKLYVLGQEIRVTWKGARKTVRWDDDNVKFDRGRSVLLKDGVEVPVQGPDPLSGQATSAVTFSANEGAFIIVRPKQPNHPDVIVKLYVDGHSDVYGLPATSRPSKYWEAGFYFDADSYLHRDGSILRYSMLQDGVLEPFEVDVGSNVGRQVKNDVVATAVKLMRGDTGISGCSRSAVTVSPSDRELAVFCDDRLDLSGEVLRELRLPIRRIVGMSSMEFLGMTESSCSQFNDAVAITASEFRSAAWSHDGSKVYWCPEGSEVGVLAEVKSGKVIQGTCVRRATWSRDDSAVVGITQCGHAVSVWSLREMEQPKAR